MWFWKYENLMSDGIDDIYRTYNAEDSVENHTGMF